MRERKRQNIELRMGGLALKLPAVTDSLEELVQTANECIDPSLLEDFENSDLGDSVEYWKFAIILAIIFKFIYSFLPELHQYRKLRDS